MFMSVMVSLEVFPAAQVQAAELPDAGSCQHSALCGLHCLSPYLSDLRPIVLVTGKLLVHTGMNGSGETL